MTMKSAYTKSAARKTALASGLEKLLNLYTYKNYGHMGGGNTKTICGICIN